MARPQVPHGEAAPRTGEPEAKEISIIVSQSGPTSALGTGRRSPSYALGQQKPDIDLTLTGYHPARLAVSRLTASRMANGPSEKFQPGYPATSIHPEPLVLLGHAADTHTGAFQSRFHDMTWSKSGSETFSETHWRWV